MNTKELQAIIDGVAPVLDAAIRKAIQPLQAEIADLKAKLAEKPDFAKAIAEEVKAQVATIQPPKDGKDCDMDAVKAMIAEAVKEIPAPADGQAGRERGAIQGRRRSARTLRPVRAYGHGGQRAGGAA